MARAVSVILTPGPAALGHSIREREKDVTLDELIVEAEALARPSWWLSSTPTDVLAGYWGGERADLPNISPGAGEGFPPRSYVITIDAGLLGPLGVTVRRIRPVEMLKSPLSIFATECLDGEVGYHSGEVRDIPFSKMRCSGEPLFARPSRSLPPFPAICLYGSDRVATWLKSVGLERHEYIDARREPAGRAYYEYELEVTSNALLYSKEVEGVLGGWHRFWPDDDFYLPSEMRSALLTIRDDAPFLEVLISAGHGNMAIRDHIQW